MKRLLLLCAIALPALLHAQNVPYGLSVDRDGVQAEQTVQVSVHFGAASRWCGLRVDLGDGDVRDIVVDTFPLTLAKQYAAAGRYVLRAQGRFVARGLSSALACDGAPRTLTLVVGEQGGAQPRRDDGRAREQRKRDEERDREQRKHDAERAREQQQREAERDRERTSRQRERDRDREQDGREQDRDDRRDTPKRDPGAASVPAPQANPPRAPTPPASRPRDGTLKVF